jgi:hypothetical protein
MVREMRAANRGRRGRRLSRTGHAAFDERAC